LKSERLIPVFIPAKPFLIFCREINEIKTMSPMNPAPYYPPLLVVFFPGLVNGAFPVRARFFKTDSESVMRSGARGIQAALQPGMFLTSPGKEGKKTALDFSRRPVCGFSANIFAQDGLL